MSLGLEKAFIAGTGIFSLMAPWINRFSALKKYQNGRESVYNLFATISSVVCYFYILQNVDRIHLLPGPISFMLVGLVAIFAYFMISEHVNKNKNLSKSLVYLGLTVALYSFGIAVITCGMTIWSASNYYYVVSGKVLYKDDSVQGNNLLAAKQVPVAVETDIDNVYFVTSTDDQGDFRFYIEESYASHVVRVHVCKDYKTASFRNYELDEISSASRGAKSLPPMDPFHLKLRGGKC